MQTHKIFGRHRGGCVNAEGRVCGKISTRSSQHRHFRCVRPHTTVVSGKYVLEIRHRGCATFSVTTGASPRRADARLGVVHARIYGGCIVGTRGRTYVLPSGSSLKLWLKKEKETTGTRFNEPGTNLAIRHMMMSSSQQLQLTAATTPAQQRTEQQLWQQHSICA